MRHLRWMFALCALAFVIRPTIWAQAVTGSLVGTVTDASGGAVSNAKVSITETNTSISRTTQTNESGNYTFSQLSPGTYAVIAEQTGFKRQSRSGVDVAVDSTARIDLVLQPGNVTETVEVTAEAPALKTDRADTGRQIEAKVVRTPPTGQPQFSEPQFTRARGDQARESSTPPSSTRNPVMRPGLTVNHVSPIISNSRESMTTSGPACCRF